MLSCIGLFAQKNDYIWLSGYGCCGYSSTTGLHFGTSVLDFNATPVHIYKDSLKMNFDWTSTSFCDSDGKLLFYTNGIAIANGNNDTIENGDSVNWGFWLQYVDPQHGNEGYIIKEGIYVIPNLTDNNQFYLFHCLADSNNWCSGALLVTLIDMSLNQGRGKVIYKNLVLINDKIGDCIAVTRHGNGKYWWILVQQKNTNCYYRVLLDETGPHVLPGKTCGGDIFTIYNFGPVKFSQDGNKFFNLGLYTGLNIFDFDRCAGEISLQTTISYPYLADSGWIGMGVATSSDSRYLYVSLTHYIFQYDLLAADIPNSMDTVGVYDGYRSPNGSIFYTAQNGPDGKIYISCGNSETDYHVIHNPDAGGDSCHFEEHGIHLPTLSCGVPSFPNYRLGALPASACDTLSGLNETARAEKEKAIKIFPNPASDVVTIDYGFTDWSKGEATLQISNELGQVVYNQKLPMYSGFQKIDISSFGQGFYNASIKRNEAVIATAKFVKQ
jgi:hypothetical protein